nr:MAG TPA: hypothetical protein [Caudoviricetes sp.]
MKFKLTPKGNVILGWTDKNGKEQEIELLASVAKVDIDNITLNDDKFIVKLELNVNELDVKYSLCGMPFHRKTKVLNEITVIESGDELSEEAQDIN